MGGYCHVMSCPCAFSSLRFPLLVVLGYYLSLSLSFRSCSQLFPILLTTSFTLSHLSPLLPSD